MNFNIDKLKQIPILDIVNRLGIIVRRNKAMCFKGHDRKTPSLSFSPQKNLWHCFGCGAGGNSITLIREYYGYSSREAIIWLEREFNLSSPNYFRNRAMPERALKIEATHLENVRVNFVSDFEIYESLFSRCTLSMQGKAYLIKRGYTEETIKKFNIKDIIEIKNEENWLLKKFGMTRLLKSGLMVRRRDRIRLIWWDHAILFPFFENNHIIYIQGRRTSSEYPKYMGLCGIIKPLYNQDVVKNLPAGSIVCICEGVTDTLTAAQVGLNAVGVLGALSFRKEWCDILNKFRIVIIPDADSAGDIFEQKIREAFLDKEHTVEVFRLPMGRDLTDLLKT